jgi:hypothetical protein
LTSCFWSPVTFYKEARISIQLMRASSVGLRTIEQTCDSAGWLLITSTDSNREQTRLAQFTQTDDIAGLQNTRVHTLSIRLSSAFFCVLLRLKFFPCTNLTWRDLDCAINN